jgi:hypothetical protein
MFTLAEIVVVVIIIIATKGVVSYVNMVHAGHVFMTWPDVFYYKILMHFQSSIFSIYVCICLAFTYVYVKIESYFVLIDQVGGIIYFWAEVSKNHQMLMQSSSIYIVFLSKKSCFK